MIDIMRLTSISCGALVALTFALPPSLRAQSTTTELTGTVRDSSGGVLPGALVTARHIDTGLNRTATAGPDGRYVIAGLPLGEWEIRVELSGFRPMVRRGVDLVVGQTSVVDASLDPGAPDEAITVTAEAPLIQSRSGELSYLVGEDVIRDLPLNGRNYTDLALLQPGVVGYPHRDGGSVVAHGLGMSINGQDPRSNVYLLDGTPLNDFTNGPAGSAAGTALGTETIREFRVEANAYGAEFGRNSGGQIHAVTKSGTNERHGSGYLYHRNDALDARNYFDTGEKPDFTRYQFGATYGGPIRHDRTFFFVGLEGLRERLGRTVSTVVPDDDARRGVLPGLGAIGVDPAVAPYLAAFPVANGANLGGGLAVHDFVFNQTLDQHFVQARLDQNVGRPGPALRALHLRRRRPAPAHRLPAVPAGLHLHEPVPDRRVPPRFLARPRCTRRGWGGAARASARTWRRTWTSRCPSSSPAASSSAASTSGGFPAASAPRRRRTSA